jgi:hypothetical protein
MKCFIFFSLIFVGTLTVQAQSKGIDPGDASFIQKYENFDFKGQFAVLIEQYDPNNYFLIDFSKLSTRFERVYFMNLSFTNYKIVNVDPDISKNKICFMSNKLNSEKEVIAIFDELKKKTSIVADTWSEAEKSKWLNENDKYK